MSKVDFLRDKKISYAAELEKLNIDFEDNSEIEAKVEAYRQELLEAKNSERDSKVSKLQSKIELLDELIAEAEAEEEQELLKEQEQGQEQEQAEAEIKEEDEPEEVMVSRSPFFVNQ